MKRLIILATVFACLASPSLATRRTRLPLRKTVQLAEPTLRGRMSLEEALTKRRSVRQFTPQPLNFTQMAQLAWAGQGITDRQRGLRTAPSAGETYPIDLYFATREGLFVYRPQEHSLEQTLTEDVRGMLAGAAGMQEGVAQAGCDIIVAGSARKIAAKFRRDARKYMLLEAGHIAQNIQLQAVCLDLGSVTVGGFESRDVRKICKLPQSLEPIYIISVGYPASPGGPEGTTDDATSGPMQRASGKKAAFIIASENFRDDELVETRRVLDAAGVETSIASSRVGVVRGMLGNIAEVRIPLNRLRVDDYDAIIFIGGSGTVEYLDSPVALNIAREAVSKKKVLAAISAAPTILANAGVLTGIRVTGFLSEREKLQQAGAIYTGRPVERDKSIITGSGGVPMASIQFGEAIAGALSGK
jgi:SagB-type dehydrogenase family enzyme